MSQGSQNTFENPEPSNSGARKARKKEKWRGERAARGQPKQKEQTFPV